jgi:hypothetical protein
MTFQALKAWWRTRYLPNAVVFEDGAKRISWVGHLAIWAQKKLDKLLRWDAERTERKARCKP